MSHPEFIERLRAQLETEINKKRDQVEQLLGEAEMLEEEICERREAIQRLIGVTPITTKQEEQARRAPVTEEEGRDAVYKFRSQTTFTNKDIMGELECSLSTATRVLQEQVVNGTIAVVRPGGPRRPTTYRFVKAS